jgi:hypothetical protein
LAPGISLISLLVKGDRNPKWNFVTTFKNIFLPFYILLAFPFSLLAAREARKVHEIFLLYGLVNGIWLFIN